MAGANAGCAASAADVGTSIVVGETDAGEVCAGNASCVGQDWLLVENHAGPRGAKQYAIEMGRHYSNSTGRSMCLELRDGGAQLAMCDTTVAEQGWQPSVAPGTRPFTLQTTWHDDANCLTAAQEWSGGRSGGAFRGFAGAVEQRALADELFPRPAGRGKAAVDADRHRLTEQYRHAYTESAALLRQIEERNAAQCPHSGGLGAPQGPLGEIYSTHATVSGMTWRYVVGVQLAARRNITVRDLAITLGTSEATPSDMVAETTHVSYRYDEAAPGFEPQRAEELRPVTADGVVLELHASSNEMCTVYAGGSTSGDTRVQTRCFPFELHAIAPLASNGWVLLGETGKFVPVSAQRLASVTALPGGGFELELLGAPSEVVRMGAADVRGGSAPVYAETAMGADGSARLLLH